jgi:electron transport complex protein RnfB
MMIGAITSLAVLTTILGGGLAWARRHIRPVGPQLVDAIDLLLPQTQCERCGYPGCRPYAEAVASGTSINRCPPGGAATIDALAALLDRPAVPLDPELRSMDPNALAFIDESRCIGCALCLPACPVDAIVGASGHMHTVIVADCTGCELCLPVCPVDCITMETSPIVRDTADLDRANVWRRRFEGHTRRTRERARAAEARRQERQARISARRNWDDM